MAWLIFSVYYPSLYYVLYTHISKILNDEAVIEGVHLGEVKLWHRWFHNGACVPLLVETGENKLMKVEYTLVN